MRQYAVLLIVVGAFVLVACGDSYPIEQALYDEYKVLVCKVGVPQQTPQDIARALELTALFQAKLFKKGPPPVEWALKHASKLAEIMDTNNCASDKKAIPSVGRNENPGDAETQKIVGPAVHFPKSLHGYWADRQETCAKSEYDGTETRISIDETTLLDSDVASGEHDTTCVAMGVVGAEGRYSVSLQCSVSMDGAVDSGAPATFNASLNLNGSRLTYGREPATMQEVVRCRG